MSKPLVAAPQSEGYEFGMKMAFAFLLAAMSLSALVATPASAAIGEWVAADVVQLRVVASTDESGAPTAALEIRLEPGWKTYWRTPGEGGLPTVIDFGASLNLASASAAYPAPRRYDDGYSVTNVYEGRVLFPIALAAALPSAPVTLVVHVEMGVCEEICIPLSLEASVELAPGEEDVAALTIINEAKDLLPGAPEPGVFEIVDVGRSDSPGGETDFTLTAIVPQAFGAELFVETPAGWYPTAAHQTGRDGNQLTFAFSLQRTEEDRSLVGASLRFTLVSAGKAIEQTVTLP